MTVVLEESDEMPLIRIEGDANIVTAAELKSRLVKALQAGKGLRVSLEKATELDITAMQLLVATERDAAKSKAHFSIEGQVPDEISAAMTHAGFRKFSAPTGSR